MVCVVVVVSRAMPAASTSIVVAELESWKDNGEGVDDPAETEILSVFTVWNPEKDGGDAVVAEGKILEEKCRRRWS